VSSRPNLGPPPQLGYTQGSIERTVERRADEAWLAAAAVDARAAAYVVGGDLIVLKKSGGAIHATFALPQARALGASRETVFLGLVDGAARFGVGIEPDAMEALKSREDLLVIDLRSIAFQGLVEAEHLASLATAKALLNWHARHRFCPNCGAPTNVTQGGWRRDCGACKAEHFPRTDPVVIMLAVADDACVLGRARRFLPNMWSCLAGYLEPGESIEEGVRREIREEAGIVCGRVHYFASQPWPFPASLMIGCHAEALSRAITVDHVELEDARWFERDEVVAMLRRQHPDGLILPGSFAVAHHLIRAWLECESGLF